MIAVADTSPLAYLVLIGEIDLLPTLFTKVLIPPAVAAELADSGAPYAVRRWIAAPRDWLEIAEPGVAGVDAALERLDRGEQEAIRLARRTGADILVLDDKAARRAAKSLDMPVTALLGVLAAGAELDKVDLIAAIRRLRKTNFRVSAVLLRDLLERHRNPSDSG